MAYTITFNANGGTCSEQTRSIDGAIGDLPPALRDGYLFIGWYATEEYGWELVDPSRIFSNDTEVTARWVKKAPVGEERSCYYPDANVTAETEGLKYQYNTDGTAYAHGFSKQPEGYTDNSDAVGNVVIPYSVTNDGNEYTVVRIGVMSAASADIQENSVLLGLTAPITVTTAENHAFYNCTSLISFIADGIEWVETSSLSRTGLTELSLPKLIEISVDLTANNSLVSLSLPKIARLSGGIGDLPALTSVYVPKLEDASVSIFHNLTSIRSLSAPSLEICGGMLSFTSPSDTLLHVSLPSLYRVSSVGSFSNATALERLTLPSLGFINSHTFLNLTSLKAVSLPSFVSCGNRMFEGCTENQIKIYLWQDSVMIDGFSVQPKAICLRKPTQDVPGMTLNGISYDATATQPQQISIGGKTIDIEWYDNTDSNLKYTISFDGQGWNGQIGDVTASYGYALPTLTVVPERDGYVFGGFYTDPDGLGLKYYNADGTCARDWDWLEDKVLYAKWTGDEHVVTFSANADGVDVSPPSLTVRNGSPYGEWPYGEIAEVTPSSFSGYQFGGWWTYPWGGTRITPETIVNILEDQTLYAKWDAIPYTVELNKLEGTGGTDVVTANYGVPMPTITVPTRTGYTFGGFYDNFEDATQTVSGTQYYNAYGTSANDWEKTSGGTLYAKWTANQYKVRFDANGGTGSAMLDESFTYNEAPKALTVNTYTRTGYDFGGWNTKADGTGTPYTNQQLVSNLASADGSVVTLYAQWTADEETVQLDAQGGIGGTSQIDATYGQPLPNIVPPTKTGSLFLGYFTETGDTGEMYYYPTGIGAKVWDKPALTDDTLYAHWQTVNYTVRFDANGGTGSMADEPFTYGTAGELSKNQFTRADFEFEEWNTSPDGSGSAYDDEESVENLTDVDGATVTLYAQWTSTKTYSITFNSNPPATMEEQTSYTQANVQYGSYIPLTAIEFDTYDGYVFKGWNTVADGSGTSYSDGADGSWMDVASGFTIDLYAIWRKIHGSGDGGKKSTRRGTSIDPTFDVPISPLPNQIISRMFRGISYDLHFRTFNGMMYVDIAVDGETVVNGVRCISNSWLIPNYASAASGAGNFMFTTLGDAYPWYEDFGDTCKLWFYDADDYAAIMADARGRGW